ncbi:hypothetical protein ABVT39_002762 [Epinephelus coioides]
MATLEYTPLHTFLWLLTAFTLTTQDLVKLSVTPAITAECNQQVTLHCNVSSSQNDLSIKHMKWSQNKMSLCSVDDKGIISTHTHNLSDFHCEYRHGQLSLIFKGVQPLDSSEPYICKLQSTGGALHRNTAVTLQECYGKVEGSFTDDGPACTFRNVHPDGDVLWFHDSHNLSHVKHYTTKQVEEGGWLTIRSYLEQKSSNVPYNCSLKSTKSGRYIASTLVQKRESRARAPGYARQGKNGAGSQGPMWTFLFIPILLTVTLK